MFEGMSALVVDDLATMRSIVKSMLAKLKFAVIDEAADGEEGFKKVKIAQEKDTQYDIVVSDWNMPKMTGIEMLECIRSVPELKNLPVMLVTAEQEREQVIQAVKAGVNGYIVKPFNEDAFSEKLEGAYNSAHKK